MKGSNLQNTIAEEMILRIVIDSKSRVLIERRTPLELTPRDRLRFKTRCFTDSGIIGTKSFVSRYYEMFKGNFNSKNEKKPKNEKGFDEVYSLKRLSNET